MHHALPHHSTHSFTDRHIYSCTGTCLTCSSVFEDKVLILKLSPVDGLAPSAIVVGEVSSLTHELWDDTVETAAFEAKAFLMCAQAEEVLYGRCQGRGVVDFKGCCFYLTGMKNCRLEKLNWLNLSSFTYDLF
uniref:Uncharacterized protein n=1 Tax=Oncorhynchus kisutch TaxID=8019 RepID=A0A8C7H9Z7_ONCKI